LPRFFLLSLGFLAMNDHGARLLRASLVGFALVALAGGGCASMRKEKIVPESIATCRQMSRDGVAAMEFGQWEQARSLLQEAVAASPTDLDARRHLAEVLWQMGDRRDAVVHMEAAVRLDPRNAPTVVRSGEMLLAVGAVDRALDRAQQAIALDPTLAGAWALRGCIYRQQGDSSRALADLQQALRFSPHATDVLLATAELQYSMGRPQRALTTLHHLLDVYAPGQEPQRALWLEGLAYKAVDRPRDAVDSLYAATLRGAPQADLLYQLALAEQAAGQSTAAANTARQALAVDSDHQPSQVLLAQLQGVNSPSSGEVIRR
jgi:tetratricopeptide (TPR) repeat protein